MTAFAFQAFIFGLEDVSLSNRAVSACVSEIRHNGGWVCVCVCVEKTATSDEVCCGVLVYSNTGGKHGSRNRSASGN